MADHRRAGLSCPRNPSLRHGQKSYGRATHQETGAPRDSGATPAATAAPAGARASPADTGSSDRRRSIITRAVRVRPVTPSDAARWLELRRALWDEGTESEHASDIAAFFTGRSSEPLVVLVAEDGQGSALGFIELSIRAYAEGCASDRVAYVEGWYVIPEARRGGVGRALIQAAEEWGRSIGCTEFASDADLTNNVSAAAHKALGFIEVGQVRCFRKNI